MPQRYLVPKVVQAVGRLPGAPRLSVVDLSCGRGEIIRLLAAGGFTVRGSRYRDDDYKLVGAEPMPESIPIDNGVDLTGPLPYGEATFDVVILCEVLEHLPSHVAALREASRILRPNGHLVITTPNLGRLHSRWHFFWTGTHKLIRRRVGWDVPPDELYAYHVNPVDLPLLHSLLYQNGLTIASLQMSKFKWKHAWLFLLYPLIWLATYAEIGRRSSNDLQRRGEQDLLRWMLHPAALGSEQLFVIARKNTSVEGV